MNTTIIVAVVVICACIIATAAIAVVVIRTLRGRPLGSGRPRHRRRRRRQRGSEEDVIWAKAREDIELLPLDDVLARLEGTRAARNHLYACRYVDAHPADESEGRLSDHDHEYVMEHGAGAWEPVPGSDNTGVAVSGGTELAFSGAGGEQSVLASLQFPNEQRVYYFEVRLDSLPEGTNVAVGVAMRGYPPLRMAGWARNSIAYHTLDGAAYYSHPLDACRTALGTARTSDTVGVGWRPNSGKMFFAINGAIVCHIRTPWARKRLFPIISADGPCCLNFNPGRRAFVLAHANMRHWSLASTEGARMPPPMYQNVDGTVLLEASPRKQRDSGEAGRHPHLPPPYGRSLSDVSVDYSAISVDDDFSAFGASGAGTPREHCSTSDLRDTSRRLGTPPDDDCFLSVARPAVRRSDSQDSLAMEPQRAAAGRRHSTPAAHMPQG
ncbi:Protein ssh4 [Coemansia biformis]|uniref:Protein ssh4 n=1 Tax=Coemansia biformis TaxID=1286918 RepID=A0A9W8CWB9_9FUNG|nr:Protein ssh4 [Coemansia biformis]